MSPFNYNLCNQPVTVYRKQGDEITRRVFHNTYFCGRSSAFAENYGKRRAKVFLMVIPGDVPLEPGDRVFAGIGPELVEWMFFLPGLVPELYEVSYAEPYYWEGNIVHWEAGNRKENP